MADAPQPRRLLLPGVRAPEAQAVGLRDRRLVERPVERRQAEPAALQLDVHRRPGELVHQPGCHGPPLVHRQDQAVAIGGYRFAVFPVGNARQCTRAQVGHNPVALDTHDQLLHAFASHHCIPLIELHF